MGFRRRPTMGRGEVALARRSAEPTIRKDILERMVAHARREFPRECCGFVMAGAEGFDRIVPATNREAGTSGFQIPPREVLDFFRELRRRRPAPGFGIYHSHPHSPPVPSRRDRVEFHYPEAVYWIVSLAGRRPEVRCYVWRDDDFAEVRFRVASDAPRAAFQGRMR